MAKDEGDPRTDKLLAEVEKFLIDKGIHRFLVAFEDPDTDCYAMARRGNLWALGAATAIREKLIAGEVSADED